MEKVFVNIPITATYRVMDGNAVLVKVEYLDIPVDTISRLLWAHFNGTMDFEAKNSEALA